MVKQVSRLENHLLATAAMGLVFAVVAPYREAEAVDICVGGGVTTINTTQAAADNCILDAGESVDIEVNGLIAFTGGGVAILISSTVAAGSITNAGSVSSTTNQAILLNTSASLSGAISNSGTLTASSDGIFLGQAAMVTGAIQNSGTITAGGEGIILSAFADVDDIINDGTIDAFSTGIIANSFSEIRGSIENSGIITTTVAEAIQILGVTSITGSIVNSGSIMSPRDGLRISSSSDIGGSIDNSGSIDAGGFGVILEAGVRVTNSILNSGSIDADDDGIGIQAGSFVDDSIENSGDINAVTNGISVLTSSEITGSIGNSGSINGGAGSSGIRIEASGVGGVTNAAGASITGGTFSIFIASPTNPITIANAGLLDGFVQLADDTLNLNGDAARVAGVISGSAASTVNVNGGFSTEERIDVGTLSIATSGRLTLNHNVEVDNGVGNAGTLAIADGAARTVTGDFTQTGGGVLEIAATSSASFGQLIVTGAADFSASDRLHVAVGAGDSLAADDQLLDVVQAGVLTANAVTVTDNSALLNFEGVIDGNTIDLLVINGRSVEEVVEPDGGNGGGAAGALDQIIADGPEGDAQTLVNALNSLEEDQDVQDAVEQLLPAITGGHAQGNVTTARAGATNVVQDRLIRLAGLNAGGGFLADPAAWIKPFAADTAQGSRNGVSGFDALTTGVAVGIDGQYTEDLRAGGAISYANADIAGRGASNSSVDIDTVQFTVYGNYAIDQKTDLNLLGAFGWNNNDSRRVINFGGLNRIAEADYDGWHAIAEAGLARSYRLSKDLNFQPSLGVTYIYAEAENYAETGAGAANLNVDDADADSLDLDASAKLTYALTEAINLSSNLGVTYDVLAGDDQVTATFEGGGGAFVTESIDPAPVGVTTGVALELVPRSGIDAVLAYDLEARDDFTNHQVQLNFRLPF